MWIIYKKSKKKKYHVFIHLSVYFLLTRLNLRSLTLRASKSRITDNPYVHLTENYQKYGKYGKYFDEPEDLIRKYTDKFDPHRQVVTFDYSAPSPFNNSNFVAPSATITGTVEIYGNSIIWYGCVIRGDVRLVRIGSWTNILDNTVITEAFKPLHSDHDGSTIIGHFVTVGKNCHLSACTIEDSCIVGDNCVLEEGSYLEEFSQLLPHSVLARNQRVPSGQVWGGNPAVYLRDVSTKDLTYFTEKSETLVNYGYAHKDQFRLPSTLHRVADLKHWPVFYYK